jgi:hypothetical protein
MMKNPENTPGFIQVFPNYKHENKTKIINNEYVIYGCYKLSPKYLGPVKHGQPISKLEQKILNKRKGSIPDSYNIENFHQGSKCFKNEIDENKKPLKEYYENRNKFYLDKKPHRHKFKINKKNKNNDDNNKNNKNIPEFFVWVDKNEEENYLTYIESRQFYCNFYERLVIEQEEYKKLIKLVEDGYNICICGYDAFEMSYNDIEKEYLNKNFPFGHERVLFTMLIEKPDNYPWRKYKNYDF